MKNIYKIFGIVALGILSLTSCNEDFLDVAQYDKVDLKSEFLNEQSALEGLTGVYDLMNPNDAPANEWGFKPNIFSGTHPTMDTQATAWDAVFNDQSWDAGNEDLGKGWKHAYTAIARAILHGYPMPCTGCQRLLPHRAGVAAESHPLPFPARSRRGMGHHTVENHRSQRSLQPVFLFPHRKR